MRQIDTKLNFSEIVLNSTTVLGFEADTELISSIPGLLVAGCSVAFPGFAGTDFDYSDKGWFIGRMDDLSCRTSRHILTWCHADR